MRFSTNMSGYSVRKINLKWPSTPYNGLAPWYVVAYRTVWLPLIYGGLAITFVGIALSSGLGEAQYWLKRAV